MVALPLSVIVLLAKRTAECIVHVVALALPEAKFVFGIDEYFGRKWTGLRR